jgi:hypothetical protein
MNYEPTNEHWLSELTLLVEENKEWLDHVRRTNLGFDENQQIEMLCQEVIKWHELSRETYTLLETLYQQFIPIATAIDGTFVDLKTNIFFNDLKEKFQRVKNNYTNNIKAKRDTNYRPDISI